MKSVVLVEAQRVSHVPYDVGEIVGVSAQVAGTTERFESVRHPERIFNLVACTVKSGKVGILFQLGGGDKVINAISQLLKGVGG